MLKPKNISTWDTTDIAKRRVKRHSFRHCLSRCFTSDDDLQCASYSTLCSGRFQRKIYESRRKVGAISYRTVRMILSCAGAQRPGSWNCDWVRSACSALKSSVRISWTVIGETMASHKQDCHLPIRSILSVPALGAFLVRLTRNTKQKPLCPRCVAKNHFKRIVHGCMCRPLIKSSRLPAKCRSVLRGGKLLVSMMLHWRLWWKGLEFCTLCLIHTKEGWNEVVFRRYNRNGVMSGDHSSLCWWTKALAFYQGGCIRYTQLPGRLSLLRDCLIHL